MPIHALNIEKHRTKKSPNIVGPLKRDVSYKFTNTGFKKFQINDFFDICKSIQLKYMDIFFQRNLYFHYFHFSPYYYQIFHLILQLLFLVLNTSDFIGCVNLI